MILLSHLSICTFSDLIITHAPAKMEYQARSVRRHRALLRPACFELHLDSAFLRQEAHYSGPPGLDLAHGYHHLDDGTVHGLVYVR